MSFGETEEEMFIALVPYKDLKINIQMLVFVTVSWTPTQIKDDAFADPILS